MGWLSFLSGLSKLFNAVMEAFRENQLRQDGKNAQQATDAKETAREVQAANDARADAERVLEREPDRLHDDDGFKRPG